MGIFNVLRPFKRRLYAEPDTKRVLIDNLMALFTIHSPSGKEERIANYCMDVLSKSGFQCNTDKIGNVYAVRGTPNVESKFILLNAHMDAVHGDRDRVVEDPGVVEYHKYEDIISTHGQAVLGGDDKAGCAVILTLAQTTDLPYKVLLTVQEESGGDGARAVPNEFYSDVLFCFTMDRKGAADVIVNYCGSPCAPETIVDALNEIADVHAGAKFYKAHGSFADTYTISRVVPAVNLSIGYYEPHTANEILDVESTHRTLLTVRGAIQGAPRIKKALDDAPSDWNKPAYRVFSEIDDYSYGSFSKFGGSFYRYSGIKPAPSCATGKKTTRWSKNKFNGMGADELIELYMELSLKIASTEYPPYWVTDDHKIADTKIEYLLTQFEVGARFADGIELVSFANKLYDLGLIDIEEFDYRSRMRENNLEALAHSGYSYFAEEEAEDEILNVKRRTKSKKKSKKSKTPTVWDESPIPIKDKYSKEIKVYENTISANQRLTKINMILKAVSDGYKYRDFSITFKDTHQVDEKITDVNIHVILGWLLRDGYIGETEYGTALTNYNNTHESLSGREVSVSDAGIDRSKKSDLSYIRQKARRFIDTYMLTLDPEILSSKVQYIIENYVNGVDYVYVYPSSILLEEIFNYKLIPKGVFAQAKRARSWSFVAYPNEFEVAKSMTGMSKADRDDYIDTVIETAEAGKLFTVTVYGRRYPSLRPDRVLWYLIDLFAPMQKRARSRAENVVWPDIKHKSEEPRESIDKIFEIEKRRSNVPSITLEASSGQEEDFLEAIYFQNFWGKQMFLEPLIDEYARGVESKEVTVSGESARVFNLNLKKLMSLLFARKFISQTQFQDAVTSHNSAVSPKPREKQPSGAVKKVKKVKYHEKPKCGLQNDPCTKGWIVKYAKGKTFTPRNIEVYSILRDYSHGAITMEVLEDKLLRGRITDAEYLIARDWHKSIHNPQTGLKTMDSGKTPTRGKTKLFPTRRDASEEDESDDSDAKTQTNRMWKPSSSHAENIIHRYVVGDIDDATLNLSLNLGEITSSDMLIAFDRERARKEFLSKHK